MLRGLTDEIDERDIAKKPLSRDELKALFAGRAASDFLNARNEEAREKGWNKTPPRDDVLIAAMARNPNLIKRPILVAGKELVLGFDEERYRKLAR